MVNKWGLQISIGGDSNINKQWDVYLALKSTFMMRGYGGSGKMRMLQQEQSGSIIRADFSLLLRAEFTHNVLFEKQNTFFSVKTSETTCRLGEVQYFKCPKFEKLRDENSVVPFFVITCACVYSLEQSLITHCRTPVRVDIHVVLAHIQPPELFYYKRCSWKFLRPEALLKARLWQRCFPF